jgi:hypothetical protein
MIANVLSESRSVTTSRLVFTNASARTGFRLSPTCSRIRYDLAFRREYLFIAIPNDKGRYHSFRRASHREASMLHSSPKPTSQLARLRILQQLQTPFRTVELTTITEWCRSQRAKESTSHCIGP